MQQSRSGSSPVVSSIVPKGIKREIHQGLLSALTPAEEAPKRSKGLKRSDPARTLDDTIASLESEMKKAAAEMDFERAMVLRDRIKNLKSQAGKD